MKTRRQPLSTWLSILTSTIPNNPLWQSFSKAAFYYTYSIPTIQDSRLSKSEIKTGPISPDIIGYSKDVFVAFAQKYLVSTHWNCLIEGIPVSTQKICFGAGLTNLSEIITSVISFSISLLRLGKMIIQDDNFGHIFLFLFLGSQYLLE